MALKFTPPNLPQVKTKEEALAEPIASTLQGLPSLIFQVQEAKRKRQLDDRQYGLTMREMEQKEQQIRMLMAEQTRKGGTGEAMGESPRTTLTPGVGGPEEQLLGATSGGLSYQPDTEVDRMRKMGTDAYGLETARISANKEKPMSFDQLIASMIVRGDIGAEAGAALKRAATAGGSTPKETPEQKSARENLANILKTQGKDGSLDADTAESTKAFAKALGWNVTVNPVTKDEYGWNVFKGKKPKDTGFKTIKITDEKGNNVALLGKLTDTAKAKEYLTKAGGDKDKARQLAADDGWEL